LVTVSPTHALTGTFDTAELPRIGAEPVTLTVERVVAPGCEAQFEAWAADVQRTLVDVPGFLGAGVLRAGSDGQRYQMVFRFTDAVSLRRWERSPERAAHLAALEPIVLETRVQRTVGVDEWFDAPSHAVPKRSRAHTLLVESAFVYPLAVAVSVFVAPRLNAVPLLGRVALTTGGITAGMMLVVTPLRRWRRGQRSL
jgi:antibiotic biosynthesis monooxygenase (ABM) superfamily enzyme